MAAVPWPEELFSLTARPGFLRLYGRESLGSLFRQSLVARRQQAHCFSASTIVDFEPETFQQMAGLVCYYNSAKFHYLYVSRANPWKTYPCHVLPSGSGSAGCLYRSDCHT